MYFFITAAVVLLVAICALLIALHRDQQATLWSPNWIVTKQRIGDGAHRVWRAYSGISIELHGLHWKWPR